MTEETKKPAKKAKPPKLEDKPFLEFMQEHFMPGFQKALEDKGLADVHIAFQKDKVNVVGYESMPECWQVVGNLDNRQFFLYFLDEDINGQKAFACTNNNKKPSTLESFMIDERRANLNLMIMFLLQRLNGQKWLARN
jgi:hypothetical protein